MLPFVLVNALHLHIEERFRRDFYPGTLGNQRCEAALVREFHLAPLLLKLIVVGKRLQLSEPVQILQPTIANA